MFRVVPDQLRVSEGWVRCGQCGEVFDANLHLQSETWEAQAAADAAAAAGDSTGGASQTPALSPAEPAAASLDLDDLIPRDSLPDAAQATSMAADSGAAPGEDLLAAAASAQRTDTDAQPSSLPADAQPDVSFVRQARRQAMWNSVAARVMLGLLCLVLAALLAAQFAFHERARIAAIEPRARPVLEQVCARLGCEVGLLQQIEWVSIDSSGFSKIRNDIYRLQLTLKNASPVDLAMPAVELTLTDAQDQPVLRKVLSMKDVGVASPVLAAGSTVPVSVGVTAIGNGSRIAGYRVLAFYP